MTRHRPHYPWRAAVVRPAATIRARWLFPGDKQVQMQRWAPLFGDDVCLALYTSADLLGFGITRGVPTHVYFRRLPHDLKSMGLVRVTGESEVSNARTGGCMAGTSD